MSIKKENIAPYFMSSDKEKRLWETAIFVFDSSAILDFYFLPNQTRDKIYIEVFKALPQRLWIPSHVEFEYLKNREKIIGKPISEKYNPLKSKIRDLGKSFNSDIHKRIEEISRETIKDDKHPHIDQTEIDLIKKQSESFQKELKSFEESILDKVKNVEKEILDVKDNDDVLKALEDYFLVGEEYSFTRIMEITKEGEHRYRFKIPPGYGDLTKKGTQIFGDLIIWNQILDFSKEKSLPIIFITNDIKKDEDWCYLDKRATEDRIERPREELIREIKDHSNVEFWMYNLPQFLFHANEYLEAKIKEETIQNITQFLNTKEPRSEYLKFECYSCGKTHSYHESEFDLDFECIDSSERNMGPENHYEAVEHLNCDCGTEVIASFNIWEYPVGIHNYDTVELDRAKLLESFYFTIDFFEDEYEPDLITCDECSGNKDQMGNMVDFDSKIDLINEYDNTHKNHKFSSVISGNCDWCNSLHIRCAKCGAANAIPETKYGEKIECEGGCGLIYFVDTSEDTDHIGEFDLKLLDHRIEQCSACGEDFIDTNMTETCDECEAKYNEE
jgi:hypothetical protein